MAHITVGFQALLALQLVMMFFEAGHPDTQVREHGDQLIHDQRRSLHGQKCIRPQELMFSLHIGDVHFTHVERFQILEDSLTSGENSLVYSSLPMCKY